MRSYVFYLLSLSAGICLLMPTRVAMAQLTIEPAFPHLSFDVPVDIQHAPGSPERLFVVERAGVIKSFLADRTTANADVFIDISGSVYSNHEEGLLGLAFHPEFESNGRFFIFYTLRDPLKSRLSSFKVDTSDPSRGDPSSEEILLEIEQPFVGHNGGQIRFGPDGYLYVSVGDGGGHDDHLGTGEDLETLFGSILRIDVDRVDSGKLYAIPPDNPFVDNHDRYREEIFAFGFRNPWRFSFDRNDFSSRDDSQAIRIWTADVGAGSFEEVNVVEKGKGYGWSVMEGFRCLGLAPDCETLNRTPPLWEYDHYLGRAIIGGFVYRGTLLPTILGKYVYGDYVSGRIWALEYRRERVVGNEELLRADSLRIYTFGEDADGELIIAARNGDRDELYRLAPLPVAIGVQDEIAATPLAGHFGNHPNPFRDDTVISYELARSAHTTLLVFDILGRTVRTLIDAPQRSGPMQVVWDGTDDAGGRLPAGMYLYRLGVDGAAVAAGQMVMLP